MRSAAFILVSASVAVMAQARCPEGSKAMGGQCYRATGAKAMNVATGLCNRPGESLVTGTDVAYYNKVKALFLASGGGAQNPNGSGGPGKFFWVNGKASSAASTNFNFLPNGGPVRDSAGNVISRNPQADPECVAGWSRSDDYVAADCAAFYSALCQRDECSITIESSDTAYSAQFLAQNVLTNKCDVFSNPATYFLLPDKVVNQGFVLDLSGCPFDQMEIKNTHNTQHNDRGTKDYTLSASDNPSGPFTDFYSGTLPDAANLGCNVPTFTINFGQQYTERYVKVTLNSHYPFVHVNSPNVGGVGLQYINFF